VREVRRASPAGIACCAEPETDTPLGGTCPRVALLLLGADARCGQIAADFFFADIKGSAVANFTSFSAKLDLIV
jgi:hypothetical protein